MRPTAVPSQGPHPAEAYAALAGGASRPCETIAYGPSPVQVADLRLPAGGGHHPVAVLVHGGCWTASQPGRAPMGGFADALVRRGIATWTIGYRRVGDPGGGWPGTFEDIAAAVDAVAEAAGRHPLDLDRITLVGHSAGAHLALWAASRARLPVPWNAPRVRAASVVAIDGPGALAPFVGFDAEVCGKPAIVPLMGGTPDERPLEYRLASPAHHLPLGLPQALVGAEFARKMRPYGAAVRASGDPIDVFEPAGANHFDVVTPGTPNGDAVVAFVAERMFSLRAERMAA